MTPSERFAGSLRVARMSRRLSHNELADLIESRGTFGRRPSPHMLAAVERGDRRAHLDLAVAIADGLGTTLGRMLGEGDEHVDNLGAEVARLVDEHRAVLRFAGRRRADLVEQARS